MRPRKRIKDLYDMINDQQDDEIGKPSFKIGNVDLTKAVQAKLN
jgi:hypothetical protein